MDKKLSKFSLKNYITDHVNTIKTFASNAIYNIKMYTIDIKELEKLIGGNSTKMNIEHCTFNCDMLQKILNGEQDTIILNKINNEYSVINKELNFRFTECQKKGIDFEEIIEVEKYSVVEIGAIENFVLEKQTNGYDVAATTYQNIKGTSYTIYKIS